MLSFALLTQYFRESREGPVHRAQDQALRFLAPLQQGTARVAEPFRDGWNWVSDLFAAKSENQRLRSEVEDLRQRVAQEQMTQRENEQLRDLLKLQRSRIYPRDMTLVPARVIARSTSAWYSTVTVDVGSDQGVGLYDAVVNGQGLVGKVTNVTGDASQVTLVTDQDSYVDAMVLPGGARGVLSGSVTGDLTLDYVDKGQKVDVGQVVVTSGMKGSVFVRGIPIGTVAAVGQQDVELYQSIGVTPFVDFHTLDLVMVVTQ